MVLLKDSYFHKMSFKKYLIKTENTYTFYTLVRSFFSFPSTYGITVGHLPILFYSLSLQGASSPWEWGRCGVVRDSKTWDPIFALASFALLLFILLLGNL